MLGKKKIYRRRKKNGKEKRHFSVDESDTVKIAWSVFSVFMMLLRSLSSILPGLLQELVLSFDGFIGHVEIACMGGCFCTLTCGVLGLYYRCWKVSCNMI